MHIKIFICNLKFPSKCCYNFCPPPLSSVWEYPFLNLTTLDVVKRLNLEFLWLSGMTEGFAKAALGKDFPLVSKRITSWRRDCIQNIPHHGCVWFHATFMCVIDIVCVCNELSSWISLDMEVKGRHLHIPPLQEYTRWCLCWVPQTWWTFAPWEA